MTSERAVLSGHRVEDLLRQLPVRPLIAQRVLDSAQDPEASLAQLARVVAMDPGLSARVLRLANSSAHAGRGATTSVERAVVLLGGSTVRAMVAAAAFPLLREDVDLGPTGLWGHGLSVAAASAVAAGPLEVSAEEAFTVGLLHDIGGAVLHYADPDAYAELDRSSEPASRIHREREVFETDHAVIGSQAVRQWGFPEPLVEAIRDHHGIPRNVSRLTQAVMIGEAVATTMIDDAAPHEPVFQLDKLLSELRLTVRPKSLVGETERRCDQLASLAEGPA